jgi:hypothetical protein
MLKSSNKGQFYILLAVVIVGFFFLLSKYVNPYSFIDTSKPITDDEIFFLNNIKDKSEKIVLESAPSHLNMNLNNFTKTAKDLAEDIGYIFAMSHRIHPNQVNFTIALISEKYVLNSTFLTPRP